MIGFRRLGLPALLCLATLLSCVDGESPTSSDPTQVVSMALVPVFQPAAVTQAQAPRPINRIRVRVTPASDPSDVLLSFVQDVEPGAEQWELSVDVPVPEDGEPVVLTIELINLTQGVESVEWSGRTRPLDVRPGSAPTASQVQQIPVTRGPASNLSVSDLELTPDTGTVTEGDTLQLSASVTTTEATPPVVYFGALDSARVQVTADGAVVGLLPGQARVVAQAGPAADTSLVTVRGRPAGVVITPDTLRADSVGARVAFRGAVVDPRGDSIPGEPLLWRSLDTLTASSLGDGLFQALELGIARVEARAAADTTLRSEAVLLNALSTVDVAVNKGVDRRNVLPGDTVRFRVSARSVGLGPAADVQVHDSLPAELVLLDADASAGTFDPSSGLWTVGDLPLGGRADLELTTRVQPGIGVEELTNVARLVGPVLQSDSVPDNDRATASVFLEVRNADLALSKELADPSQDVFEGTEVTFRIVAANFGPFPAAGVLVRDSLPAGMTFVQAAATSGTVSSSGTWQVGGMASGVQDTLVLVARVDSGRAEQTLTNRAAIAAGGTTTDPDLSNNDGEVGVTVGQRSIDLYLEKGVDEADPFEGDTVLFTVLVENFGPSPARQVTVWDSLPGGLTPVWDSVSAGSFSLETGNWNVGSLGNGVSATLRLRAVVDSGTVADTLTNVARVVGYQGAVERNAANNVSSAAVRIAERQADLALTKTVDRATALEGDTVAFSVALENFGPHAAADLSVTDSLPPGLTAVSASATSGSFDLPSGVWTLGALADGAADTLTLLAAVDSGTFAQTLVNLAFTSGFTGAVDPDTLNNGATASVSVERREADITVVKAVDETAPFEGDTVTFTVTVENVGPDTATSVQLLDTLPPDLTFVDATPARGGYDDGTGIWSVGDLAPGEPTTLELRAAVDSGTVAQTRTNVAWSQGLSAQVDTDPANDTASASLTVDQQEADLVVAKAVNETAPFEGDTVTYTVVVESFGPADVTELVVLDTLRAGLTFVSASASAGSFDDGTGTWTVGDLPSGAADTLTLLAAVDSGTFGQTLTNAAAIGSFHGAVEGGGGDELATASLTVDQHEVDLVVAKSVDEPAPFEGDTVTYTVVVESFGPDPVTDLVVLDSLGAGLTFASAAVTAGSFDGGTGLWTVGALAPGASDTLTLRAAVDSGTVAQTLTNDARVEGFHGAVEAAPGDETASASLTVDQQLADLSVAKTVSPFDVPPDVGDTVDFEVTVTNDGPGDATDVQVTETLPAGLTLVGFDAQQGSYAAGVWTIPTLGVEATATLQLVTSVDPGTGGQTLTNTVEVTGSNQFDPDPVDDTASASVTVTSADAVVEKMFAGGSLTEGDTATYLLLVRNLGPDEATGIEVTDTLATGLAFAGATPGQGSFDGTTWTVGSVAVGDTAVLDLRAAVEAGTGGQTLTNEARITAADRADPDGANDVASAAFTVMAADLSVTKEVTDTTPVVGQQIQYRVTVLNNGPDDATGVAVLDAVPAGLQFQSTDTITAGSYDEETGIWTVGDMAAGSADTLAVRVEPVDTAAGSTSVNTATASATFPVDPDPLNDTASVEVTVEVQPLARSFTTAGNTQLRGGGYAAPATPHVSVADNLLTGTPSLAVTADTVATARGGQAVLEADGDFLYTPPVGSAAADTFTYTVTGAQTATVEVLFGQMIWYADNTSELNGGATGRSHEPHGLLDDALGDAGPGDWIRVDRGDGTASGHFGGFSLDADQHLLGEGVALAVPGLGTLAPAGLPPVVTAGEGTAINLADGNRVAGLTIQAPDFGRGLRAFGTTDATVDTVDIVGVSGNSDEGGVAILGGSGTFDFNGLSIDTVQGPAFEIGGGSPVVTVDVAPGSITNAVGHLLRVDTLGFGGSVTFTGGDLTDTGGDGIRIADNSSDVTVENRTTFSGSMAQAVLVSGNIGEVRLDDLHIDVNGDGVRAFSNDAVVGLGGSVATTDGRALSLSTSVLDVALDTVRADNADEGEGGDNGVWISAVDGSSTTTIGLLDLNADQTGSSALSLVDYGSFQVTDPASQVVAVGGLAMEVEGDSEGTQHAFTGTFADVSASGTSQALSLVNLHGDVAILGGTLTGETFSSTTPFIDIDGGSGSFSYGGTVAHTGDGIPLSIQNMYGGTVEFSGPVGTALPSSRGVHVVGNSGGNVLFSGELDLRADTATAFWVSNSNLVEVTGASSEVASSAGAGVVITNSTIGAAGVTFEAVSSSFGSTGITLLNTGTTGPFAVTGTGTPASGGTIQSTVVAGVQLTDVQDVSLAGMAISGNSSSGILGSGVTDFALLGSDLIGNGGAGLDFTGLFGTALVSGTSVSGSADDNLRVVNTSGSLDLTVENTELEDAVEGDGASLGVSGTPGTTLTATFDDNLVQNNDDNIYASASGSAALELRVEGLQGPNIVNGGTTAISVDQTESAPVTIFVDGNQITDPSFRGIDVNSSFETVAGTLLDVTVSDNQILEEENAPTDGVRVNLEANPGAPDARLLFDSNTMVLSGTGIFVSTGTADFDLDLTALNNDITTTSAQDAFELNLGVGAGSTPCLNLLGNTIDPQIDLSANDTNVRVERLLGGSGFATEAQVEAHFEAENTTTALVSILNGEGDGLGVPDGTCLLPGG